jgi:hypothetical protein
MEELQMKILLSKDNGNVYVWKTAKYNEGRFLVDGNPISEDRIISIINDNRSNYSKCSCCGQIFKKGDDRFEEHKRNAASPTTCFGCRHLVVEDYDQLDRKIEIDANGEFVVSTKKLAELKCGESGYWSYDSINSSAAKGKCKKRQCADAELVEIEDFFTKYPGAFNDIITIDALLDDGYDINYVGGEEREIEIVSEHNYAIYVIINKQGIVDSFYVWVPGESWTVRYSKKYDKLFWVKGSGNVEWNPDEADEDIKRKMHKIIAKLYR